MKNCGETSRKKSHDMCDSDRPLKKARYLWQVKGNYHLKDNNPKNNESSDEEKQEVNQPINENVNNNVTQSRNKHICNERACIEHLIATSDKIMEFPDPDSPPRNIDKSISDEIPITLVKPRPKNEDFYLRKWQARQIAKGFVDNTINRVLENWMVAPFDAADFVENCDNGGQIEDEGILMAIQSHGLQSSTRESTNNCRISKIGNECTCSKTRKDVTLSQPLPFHARPFDESMEQEYNEILKEERSSVVLSSEKTDCFDAMHSDDSKENDPTLHITENIQDLALPNSSYEMHMDDSDFLDAAVSAAIKKKGLMSYNCVDYG